MLGRHEYRGPVSGGQLVLHQVRKFAECSVVAVTLATQGNLNNDIGVPLTLLRMNAGHEVGVVELGMNHPGEIGYLAQITRPTVALVNNAQREHQEFMATVEAVARENGAVLSSLGPEGVAVFPAGEEYSALWQDLAGGRACMTFADSTSAADIALAGAEWLTGYWQVGASTRLRSRRDRCAGRTPRPAPAGARRHG